MPSPTALQWAHLALDGGLFRLTTSNDDLGPIRDEIQERLVELFPCIGPDPEVALTDGALTAWRKWLGYETAIEFVEGGGTQTAEPVAGNFGLVRVESDVAGIKEKLGRVEGRDLVAMIPKWRAEISRSRSLIPCVRAALASTSTSRNLAALSGLRRGKSC